MDYLICNLAANRGAEQFTMKRILKYTALTLCKSNSNNDVKLYKNRRKGLNIVSINFIPKLSFSKCWRLKIYELISLEKEGALIKNEHFDDRDWEKSYSNNFYNCFEITQFLLCKGWKQRQQNDPTRLLSFV
jgi:hypothetical protein